MGKSIGGRITLIAVLTAASIILVLPSLTDSLPVAWKEKSPKIHLGLDLQGGVFLRLAVEIDKAIENTTLRYADDARAILREKGIPVLAMAKNGIDGFSLTLPPGDFADRALEGVKGRTASSSSCPASRTSSGPSSWWGRPRSWSSSSWTRGRAWRRRSKETSARTTSSCT